MIEIRRAGVDDLDALHALAEESLHDPWSPAALLDELRHPEASVYLAVEAEHGVGYLALRGVAGEVHVHSLAVRSRARRRGVARTLLDHAGHEQAEGQPWLLEVREDNGGARAFYGRLGFQEVGLRPRYYRDGVAAVLMTRGPGAAPN